MPRQNRTKRERQARSKQVIRRKKRIAARINPKKRVRSRSKPKVKEEI